MMLVSAFGFADVLGAKNVVLDPSWVAAQVVSGIGFLGAGSILLRGEIVRGLAAAASIWSVAGIGLAVGGGIYTAAAVGATHHLYHPCRSEAARTSLHCGQTGAQHYPVGRTRKRITQQCSLRFG